jgi:hypothetical protein
MIFVKLNRTKSTADTQLTQTRDANMKEKQALLGI